MGAHLSSTTISGRCLPGYHAGLAVWCVQREADKLIEGNDQTGEGNEHADVPAHGADQSLGMTGFRLGIQALVVERKKGVGDT